MRDQLLAHYAQDPATDGCGIYLVFWFGENGPPPPDGSPPHSAQELQTRLTESLSAAQARKISVCVIDVSRPAASNPDRVFATNRQSSGAALPVSERHAPDSRAESSLAPPVNPKFTAS